MPQGIRPRLRHRGSPPPQRSKCCHGPPEPRPDPKRVCPHDLTDGERFWKEKLANTATSGLPGNIRLNPDEHSSPADTCSSCYVLFNEAVLLCQHCCSGTTLSWWRGGPDAPLQRARSNVSAVTPANTAPYRASATTGSWSSHFNLDVICRN